MSDMPFTALIDYEDAYVQPLVLEALKSQLPESSYELSSAPADRKLSRFLQILSYEAIDFEQALQESHSLINAYVIRKALIRKHYLSNTILAWVTKHPGSFLRQHFKSSEDFELDYAEFLDDALVEAFDLRSVLDRNADLEADQREWWILKPGMSDRGQGIRLFSTMEELTAIFEEWDAQNPDDDESTGPQNDEEEYHEDYQDDSTRDDLAEANGHDAKTGDTSRGEFIMTSHLRHFIAQPYVHPPLLLYTAPYNNRKFHIRTYVVAAGALRVYVYAHMLALFASESYTPPWKIFAASEESETIDQDLLQKMRNIHLTNTCVQRSSQSSGAVSTSADFSDENVFLLSKLPLPSQSLQAIKEQIYSITSELFQAALAQPTNFQPLPQAFEIFGIDFLVDAESSVWLLEVNAFPDFAQTGDELRDVVVKGLWEEVMKVVVGPHFGVADMNARSGTERLVMVLDKDLGRG